MHGRRELTRLPQVAEYVNAAQQETSMAETKVRRRIYRIGIEWSVPFSLIVFIGKWKWRIA